MSLQLTATVILLCFMPSKVAAYIAIPILIIAFIVKGQWKILWQLTTMYTSVVVLSTTSMLLDYYAGREINPAGFYLSLVTYFPLLFMLAHMAINGGRSDNELHSENEVSANWFRSFCALMLLGQGFVAFAEFLYTHNSDLVAGTMGLDVFMGSTTDIRITQVFFTFNIIGLIFYLLSKKPSSVEWAAIVTGLVTCALAQSGHQVVFAAMALGLAAILSKGVSVRYVFMCVLVSVGLFQSLAMLNPGTKFNLREWPNKFEYSAQFPKRLAVAAAFEILAEPKNMLIGVGGGQFSSRAALISSGAYLGISLPSFAVGKSYYYTQYTERSIARFAEVGEGSAIAKPYFSWLNILVEFGAAGTSIVVILFTREFRRNALSATSSGRMANAILIFLCLCMFIENYAEFVQGIFGPILLYVTLTAQRVEHSNVFMGKNWVALQ